MTKFNVWLSEWDNPIVIDEEESKIDGYIDNIDRGYIGFFKFKTDKGKTVYINPKSLQCIKECDE